MTDRRHIAETTALRKVDEYTPRDFYTLLRGPEKMTFYIL